MPRRTRMYVPGLAYHLVQRGNNREVCFIEPEGYAYYLELWQRKAKRYGLEVHAYCLMSNHVHFLVTPQTETSVSATMKGVGSCYAQYINRRYRRTGTLWEGPVALFVWIYLQNRAIASSIQNGTGIPERYRHGYGKNAAVFSVKSLKLVGYCALALSVLWIAFMLWLSFGEGNTFLK